MKLAELKRILQVGVKLKTLENCHGKFIGEIAPIKKVQSNGVYIDRNGKNSWLQYPKASDIIFENDNIFTFIMGNFKVKYEIVKDI